MSDEDRRSEFDKFTDSILNAILVLIACAVFVFMLPAILILWPMCGDLGRAVEKAFGSGWAYAGSAIFWFVVFNVVKKRR